MAFLTSGRSGGSEPREQKRFFNPANYIMSYVLLVEPTRIKYSVPFTWQGQTRKRDEALADVTVFNHSDALESGRPSEVLKDVWVTHRRLVETLDRAMDDSTAVCGVVRKVPVGESGAFAYEFRDVSEEIQQQVARYVETRDSELDDAPDFD